MLIDVDLYAQVFSFGWADDTNTQSLSQCEDLTGQYYQHSPTKFG